VNTYSLAPTALLGKVLGGAYRIESQLDEGGMGLVYKAEHVRLKRPVAVKVMASHLSQDENAVARFTREAEIISQLHHPHVVQVLDFDTTEDGRLFLVMELLKGRPLDAVMTRHQQLGISPAVRVAIQTASALGAAHDAGIVHRDLKPANIFLVDTGAELFVKLLDFGISKRAEAETRQEGRKLTGEFDILGTPEYMAPEQALGKTALVDARGDQYAVAVILYEMLAGRVPFTADDVMELLQRVIRDVPVPPSQLREEIPDKLDEVILKAMSKAPEDRYDTIAEFSEALEHSIAEISGSNPNLGRTTDPKLLRPSIPPASDGAPTVDSSRVESGIPQQEPNTGTRRTRTSWHSKDPLKAVQGLIDRARQELGLDNVDLAVSCAESALEIAHSAKRPEIVELIKENAGLFQRTFERRLGKLSRRISVRPEAGTNQSLSPEQAYLLSRLDGGLSIEEAIDLSPLSREQTLGQIVGLVRTGHISLGA
jgi:serine/threonine-protein kinase